jgi:membrane carboxypeptidase/penicillin-binding protein
MREVVTSGTGRSLASHPVAIAGKTGTAELDDRRSHGWFVGFAPYSESAPPRIAFAVIVENGGYGGRVAAPLAGEIVSAAAERGLLTPRGSGFGIRDSKTGLQGSEGGTRDSKGSPQDSKGATHESKVKSHNSR